MDSSEESLGLKLLRKWKINGQEITLTFTGGLKVFEFGGTGTIEDVTPALLSLAGEFFGWTCDLRIVGFGAVCSEEYLAKTSPSLVGVQPETIELLFPNDATCKLVATSPSRLAN